MHVMIDQQELVITFPPGTVDPTLLNKVRALPSRRFDPVTGAWRAPYTRENWQAAKLLGLPLDNVPEPKATGYAVLLRADGLLAVRTPYSERNQELCRLIPDHHGWDGVTRCWTCKATPRNLVYLRSTFTDADWSPEALAVYDRLVTHPEAAALKLKQEKQGLAGSEAEVTDYVFGGPAPFRHQRQAFLLSRDQAVFALFMEMGTAKSKILIDTAAWLYTRGKIDQVIVVAPNSVKTNWVTDEIPLHMPAYVPYTAAFWSSGAKAEHRRQLEAAITATDKLRWLVVNIETFSTKNPGHDLAVRFVRQGRTLFIVDESSRIKAPGAARSKAIVTLAKKAPYRRIATGTPVTQSPLDVYQQMRFLDPTILGFSAFYAFRNHFAIMGGWNNKEVIAYANLEELQRLVEPYSFRVTKAECLDLPPKVYEKRTVELSTEQRTAYDQMAQQMRADLGGRTVTAPIVLTQLLRLQQITGGFAPTGEVKIGDNGVPYLEVGPAEAIPGPNPKINALRELLEDVHDGKVIVWARFRAEIAAIAQELRATYGADSVVEFHGGLNDSARIAARTAFQEPQSPVRFFVGQTEAGGLGITLTQARTVVYFSNSFSLESRLQSEDRAHRIGQTGSVTYVDLVARDTLDVKLLAVLREKNELARTITGDAWREWL